MLRPGPWFNIKMSSFQYRKSHCGDKTVVRSSYLHNGIFYTGKMTSLYWFGPPGYIDGLLQDCRISGVLAVEILQSCTKSSTGICISKGSVLWLLIFCQGTYENSFWKEILIEQFEFIAKYEFMLAWSWSDYRKFCWKILLGIFIFIFLNFQ